VIAQSIYHHAVPYSTIISKYLSIYFRSSFAQPFYKSGIVIVNSSPVTIISPSPYASAAVNSFFWRALGQHEKKTDKGYDKT